MSEVRFHAKYERKGPDECWLWTASKYRQGYGQVRFDGRPTYAHRVAWVLTNGPIPVGLCVCHKCDTPACVNPAHLFLGTQQDNMSDKVRKNRQARQRGVDSGMARFSESDVLEIKRRLLCHESCVAIAGDFTVDPSTIHAIKRGKTWKHLEPEQFAA